jgi:predicted nucleic acid-binding protein
LLKRVELQQLPGFTSIHVLADVAHRLMTLEAINRFGWPASGIANHLRRRHTEIPKLTVYQQAMSGIGQMGIQLLPLTLAILQTAASICQQYELMTGDALVVALMRSHGLTNIASLDADFDRVPGMARYTPT